MSNKQRFDQLMNQANGITEDHIPQIFDKLDILREAKEIAGDLWALWSKKSKAAATARKEVINHVKIYGAYLKAEEPMTNDKEKEGTLPLTEAKEPTTDKMREAVAELIAKPYEDEENNCKSAAEHYKNKWESISEHIAVLKKKYDHLKDMK